MVMAAGSPREAFRSIPMYDRSYDGTPGCVVANPINRRLINSAAHGLVRRKHGSLTIAILHDQPNNRNERANWLPAPKDPWPRRKRRDGHPRSERASMAVATTGRRQANRATNDDMVRRRADRLRSHPRTVAPRVAQVASTQKLRGRLARSFVTSSSMPYAATSTAKTTKILAVATRGSRPATRK
jgi:hypothetical protein